MNLHILFIQRAEDYLGQHAPEARIVWDEYSVDNNPEGFDEAVAEDLRKVGDVYAHRVIVVDVDDDEVTRLLIGTPTIPGQVDDEGHGPLLDLVREGVSEPFLRDALLDLLRDLAAFRVGYVTREDLLASKHWRRINDAKRSLDHTADGGVDPTLAIIKAVERAVLAEAERDRRSDP